MASKVVLGIVGIVLLSIVAVVGIQIGIITFGGQDIADTMASQTHTSCENIKTGACRQSGTPTENDYPDSCFNNGEHILENPYTCSE